MPRSSTPTGVVQNSNRRRISGAQRSAWLNSVSLYAVALAPQVQIYETPQQPIVIARAPAMLLLQLSKDLCVELRRGLSGGERIAHERCHGSSSGERWLQTGTPSPDLRR